MLVFLSAAHAVVQGGALGLQSSGKWQYAISVINFNKEAETKMRRIAAVLFLRGRLSEFLRKCAFALWVLVAIEA